MLAARGESLAAFGGRCIPAGGVAPRSHTPGILGRRALPAGRLARLGATPGFHHGLLAQNTRRIRLCCSPSWHNHGDKCPNEQCRRRDADRERIVRTDPDRTGKQAADDEGGG